MAERGQLSAIQGHRYHLRRDGSHPCGVKYDWKYHFEASRLPALREVDNVFLSSGNTMAKETFRDVSSVLKVQGALNKYFRPSDT